MATLIRRISWWKTSFDCGSDTGGKAFLDYNDLSLGIVQAQKAIESYYLIGYYSTNTAPDGKFRKITVQLVEPGTSEPLRMTNEKGKPFKYSILAKAGYKAPRAVE